MNTNNNMRVVKRIKLANYLHEHGIDFEYSRVDYKNPKYKVFIYERTDELDKLIEQYYKEGELQGKIK